MKRFLSPLQRLLRVREQAERMTQLGVSRARANVDTSASRLLVAEAAAKSLLSELTDRLNQQGHSLTLAQISDTYRERLALVDVAVDEHAMSQSQLDEVLCEYRKVRQEREMVERVLAHKRDEHRRKALTAAAIDLQEWSLRRTADDKTEQPEEGPHA